MDIMFLMIFESYNKFWAEAKILGQKSGSNPKVVGTKLEILDPQACL